MPTQPPIVIEEDNLSYAWGKVFLKVMEGQSAPPILISITDFKDGMPRESTAIRRAVDETLTKSNKHNSSVSAQTIFPHDHWTKNKKYGRQNLFEWYITEFLPRLKARDRLNAYGTYFERMICFTGIKGAGGNIKLHIINQLDHIINVWCRDRERSTHSRESALQVSCFDPAKDHTGQPVRGFPCLQQVSFSYDKDDNLAVCGYYPTQYIFDRAYGNYMGLCYLGRFMAEEMGMRLVRMNCFIQQPKLGSASKSYLQALKDVVLEELK
jgi:thymidylate synthase